MELLSKPTSSIEDIAVLVARVEELVDGNVPLIERKDILDLLWVLEHRTSNAASELMTGYRSDHEKHVFANTLAQLRHLTEYMALDIAYRAYDETNDTGKTMKVTLDFLEEVLADTVGADYEKRLDDSPFEQMKQWVAHRGGVSRAASIALTGAATLSTGAAAAYFIKTGDVPVTDFETLRRGGLFGVAAALGAVAMSAAKKSLPRKVGSALGNKWHTTSQTYALDEHSRRDASGVLIPSELLKEKYAERDLKGLVPLASELMLSFAPDINSKEDFAVAINKVLTFAEVAILQSYGVDFEESWIQQTFNYLREDDALQYKYIELR